MNIKTWTIHLLVNTVGEKQKFREGSTSNATIEKHKYRWYFCSGKVGNYTENLLDIPSISFYGLSYFTLSSPGTGYFGLLP